ncbi:MAG: hypothetical protein KDB07_07590, partial [Planctomycetes bacterium]|nr:hypothetical protein [Planctomycetota bacterium]
MKKLATIALLLTMLASLGACSQRGMYDASMWFQDQTNGRNTNLTVARGARSMWGTGMQRTADSVSVNTAMVELSKKDTRTPFTVERAATSL